MLHNKKNKMKTYRYFLTFAISLICSICQAQLTEWENYTSHKWVRRLAINGDDLWITTEGGAIKYNKLTGEKTFFKRTNSGLPGNNIIGLACRKDEVWFGTKYHGITKFDGKKFTQYTTSNSELEFNFENSCFTYDSKGNIWIGSLLFFYKFDGKHWERFTTPKSSISAFLSFEAMTFDSEGTLWFGGCDALGIGSFGKYTETNGVETINCVNYINSICIDKNGNKWISSSYNGISKYNGYAMTRLTKENSNFPSNNTHALQIDRDDNIWFGSNEYLVKYDGVNFVSVRVPVKSNNDLVTAIVFDGNTIWVGTRKSGLFKYSDGEFENISLDEIPITTNTMAFCSTADSKGNVWIGLHDGLLKYDSEDRWHYLFVNRDSLDNTIAELAIDNLDRVWVGLYYSDTCLIRINANDTVYYTTSNSPLKRNTIQKIAFDRNNNIWIGTYYNGLFHYDGNNWMIYNTQNSPLKSNTITSIIVDDKNQVWCGVDDNGLYKFDGVNWTEYNKENSPLPTNLIRSLAFDSKGRLWMDSGEDGLFHRIGVLSGGGLVCFDGMNWKIYNTSNSGIPSNTVMDIAIDSDDNLWLATFGDVGLTKFDNQGNWFVYNVENSNISNNDAIKIVIDKKRDKIWLNNYFSGGISVAKMNSIYSGIEKVQTDHYSKGLIYDLSGKRITYPQKGMVYIKNGVKYIEN